MQIDGLSNEVLEVARDSMTNLHESISQGITANRHDSIKEEFSVEYAA